MKKVAGTLKLDQAQFRELEAFAKFGSDLDAATLNVIEKGRRNVEILKQAQNDPFTVERSGCDHLMQVPRTCCVMFLLKK